MTEPTFNFASSHGLTAFTIGSAIMAISYCIGHYSFPAVKQRGWVLSLVASSVMTLGCLPRLYDLFINAGFDIRRISPESPYTQMLSGFFSAFLLMDLVLGVLFYRPYLDPLSGWVHHIAYLLLMGYLLNNGSCYGFILMCPLEFPTMLLSLGQINKKFRNDVFFGTAFFATRILYHGIMITQFYAYYPVRFFWKLTFLFYPMHLFWFYGFLRQQVRLAKKKNATGRKQEERIEKRNGLPEKHPAVIIQEYCKPKNDLVHPNVSLLETRIVEEGFRPRFRRHLSSMIRTLKGPTPQPISVH
ncbi:uncharacterized protein VTP21DRAFT_5596 [Calcarisporiella thermophila]|uniref:uncharacterized protein n=1 Tax=Calcarisporiella thermophila TaxID=911321 RepID=UPI003743091A